MKTILVVEDEKELIDNLRILLESEGYHVILAENGVQALREIEQNIPDLIISDIMMPFMNGYELFNKVKKDLKTKITPFIFLTAKSDMPSLRKGMNLGADDYISKPFVPEDLLQAIKIRLEKDEVISGQIDDIRESISKYIPHELRTPLVAILGFAQIIISEIDSLEKEEILNMAERINFGAERLHNRIEKFIQLSEFLSLAEEDKTKEDIKCFFNSDIVKMVILRNSIIREREKKITVSVEPAELKIPELYMEILIKELLENAVKFSEVNKPISVLGKQHDNFYRVEIRDLGIGMDEYQISQLGIFKQFDRDKYQQEGNGLGLEIVKRIMNLHTGKFEIDSKINSFTNIVLYLPLAK